MGWEEGPGESQGSTGWLLSNSKAMKTGGLVWFGLVFPSHECKNLPLSTMTSLGSCLYHNTVDITQELVPTS